MRDYLDWKPIFSLIAHCLSLQGLKGCGLGSLYYSYNVTNFMNKYKWSYFWTCGFCKLSSGSLGEYHLPLACGFDNLASYLNT